MAAAAVEMSGNEADHSYVDEFPLGRDAAVTELLAWARAQGIRVGSAAPRVEMDLLPVDPPPSGNSST